MRDTQTYFWYGNAAARTFGRAHRRRPYVFRLGGLRVNGCFVWADCVWNGWFRLGNGLCMAYAFRLGACVQMPLIHVGEWRGRTKPVGLVLLIAQGWRR